MLDHTLKNLKGTKRRVIRHDKLDTKIELKQKTTEELFDLVKEQLVQLNSAQYTNKIVDTAKVESKLYSIRKELLERKSSIDTSSMYPEVDDVDFTQTLLNKKEFAVFKYPRIEENSNFNDLVNSRCSTFEKQFSLTKNQKFLKNFMSPQTHYNSLLLFHGTGVGKTCTAISIAEQFDNVYTRKIITLMPTTLKENFKKQLFDISQLDRKNMGAHNQCIAHKYLEQITDKSMIDNDVIDKKVNQIIKDRYQFYGFREFANIVLNMKKNLEFSNSRQDVIDAKLNNNIKELFSDCVFIIDEAHNIRAEGEDTQKIVPPLLLKVLQAVTNVKLVILTATPMFNESREIVWLLNLILANEKKPLLEVNDIFDSSGNFKEKGKKLLTQTVKGYVSYMRGQNPFAFPMRFDPSINNDKHLLSTSSTPKLDIYGLPISENDQIKHLKIVASEMGQIQTDIYRRVERVDQNITNNTDNKQSIALSTPIQISNIVYPSKSQLDLSTCYGEKGFFSCFDKVQGGSFKVQYKEHVRAEHGEFLHPKNIASYACKLKRIIEYIKKSDGIVFVYSYYLWGGILPLALALEHAGFQRSGGNNFLVNAKVDKPFMLDGAHKASYSILTGDSTLTPSLSTEIEKIRSLNNKDGNVVKVILGTNVTSEGIDFKCIREVHILEPWHHLNRIEQIVGRAIRTCSHSALPIEKRNTTVFYHASIPSYYKSQLKESLDLRMYRLAEKKQEQIKQVEDVLKNNAIDCVLNENVSYFDPKQLNMKTTVITSQNTFLENFPVGDHPQYTDYTRVQCNTTMNKVQHIDNSTFSPFFYRDDIEDYVSIIINLYQDYAQTFTYNEIEQAVHKKLKTSFDTDILKFALEQLVSLKRRVVTTNNLDGYISYHGLNYIFFPQDEPFSYITTFRRQNFEPIQTSRIKLSRQQENNTKKPENASTNLISDIISKAESVLKSTIGVFDKNEPLFKASIDFVVDRLDESALIEAATACMHTTNENTQLIQDSLVTGNLLVKHGKETYLRTPYKINKPMLWKSSKFSEMTPLEMINYDKVPNIQPPDINKPLKSYKCYVDVSEKGVHFKRLSENNKSDGYICSQTATLKVDDFIKEIQALDQDTLQRVQKKIKPRLCEVYELIIRYTTPQMFARPYVALMIKARTKK